MAKLVNVGSLCIDLVYPVPSIVKAGETLASGTRQVFPGGKGLNQSIAAARAGAEVKHFGAVGDDGDMLLEQLQQDGVDTAGVQRLTGPSGQAIIQVDAEGQNAIVISGGSNRALSEDLIEQAVAELDAGDWLLLQNEVNDVGQIMARAAETGADIAFNVAPPDERIFDYPIELLKLLVVNEPEAMALARQDTPKAAFSSLVERYPKTHVVLTRGKDGLLLHDADTGEQHELGTFKVTAVDETAAGDAFVGYLLAALVAGKPLLDAMPMASAAGALAVTGAGAAPSIPTAAAVATLLKEQPDAIGG
ncbi:MAG: ribokinase [Pseudomonadaceae bacterium]|nr:ribokinase [Pseudomonadaceae bacterium]